MSSVVQDSSAVKNYALPFEKKRWPPFRLTTSVNVHQLHITTQSLLSFCLSSVLYSIGLLCSGTDCMSFVSAVQSEVWLCFHVSKTTFQGSLGVRLHQHGLFALNLVLAYPSHCFRSFRSYLALGMEPLYPAMISGWWKSLRYNYSCISLLLWGTLACQLKYDVLSFIPEILQSQVKLITISAFWPTTEFHVSLFAG